VPKTTIVYSGKRESDKMKKKKLTNKEIMVHFTEVYEEYRNSPERVESVEKAKRQRIRNLAEDRKIIFTTPIMINYYTCRKCGELVHIENYAHSCNPAKNAKDEEKNE
jgi:hypothetical protein